jgi:hypothetical protein
MHDVVAASSICDEDIDGFSMVFFWLLCWFNRVLSSRYIRMDLPRSVNHFNRSVHLDTIMSVVITDPGIAGGPRNHCSGNLPGDSVFTPRSLSTSLCT